MGDHATQRGSGHVLALVPGVWWDFHSVDRFLREVTEQPMERSSTQGSDVSFSFAAWSPGRTQALVLLLLENIHQ